MNLEDDILYLKETCNYEMKNSTDNSTKNCAIIVNDNKIISIGVNEFPFNVKETKERWQKPKKYSYVEHAERNAIYNAAKHGRIINNSTMFCPWYACDNCARAIIQSGIKRVVGLKSLKDKTYNQWKESVDLALEMLSEADVITDFIDFKLGINLRFNNEDILI